MFQYPRILFHKSRITTLSNNNEGAICRMFNYRRHVSEPISLPPKTEYGPRAAITTPERTPPRGPFKLHECVLIFLQDWLGLSLPGPDARCNLQEGPEISLWRKAIIWTPVRSFVAAGKQEYKFQISPSVWNSARLFFGAGSTIVQHKPDRERGVRREKMLDKMLHRTSFSLNSDLGVADGPDDAFVLVVLNYNVPKFVPALWKQARLRICADGGANRIYDELPALLPEEDAESVRQRYKPDVIKGDLDSIRPAVRDFYANLGTTVIDESYDQDTTDFQKCIAYIRNSDVDTSHSKVVVVGALGGRFDHVVAHINVLYNYPRLRITLLSDDSLLYLLPQGFSHEIQINSAVEGPHCGLIPFGTTSEKTTTSGLRWNLNGDGMAFGSLISTSNLLDHDVVTVVSDSPLIWTVTIRQPGEEVSST